MVLLRRKLESGSWSSSPPRAADFELVESSSAANDTLDWSSWMALPPTNRPPRVRILSDLRREALDAERAALLGVRLICVESLGARDGRTYSLARHIRVALGFDGELRVTGRVVRDQLGYLARIGFDAFELDARQASSALAALDEHPVLYQRTVTPTGW